MLESKLQIASRKRESLGALAVVVCAAIVPYLVTLGYGFVYDDYIQILANPAIRAWRFVPTYFLKPIAGFYNGATSARYYRPIFFIWLRINYCLWGDQPLGWHATAVVLHTVASILVLCVLRKYFKDVRCALVGAAIFAVYPVHIETVAWISGCSDALMTVMLLTSLYLWILNCEASSWMRYIGSLVCCALALLTKETAIVLPLIIFLHAFAGSRLRDSQRKRGLQFGLRETLPYLGIAVAYLALRSWVLKGVPSAPQWLSRKQALLSVPSLVLFYLRNLVWPWRLSLFYDFMIVSKFGSYLFWVPLVVLALILTAVYVWWYRTKNLCIPAAAFWFALPLAPVLYIRMFQQDDFLHDRYLYLSVLGLSILAGVLGEFIWRGNSNKTAPSIPTIGVSIVLVLFALATTVQARPWASNLLLYTNAVQLSPQNTMARNNLADQYAQLGRYFEAGQLLIPVLHERPDMWLANYNYGFINYRLGNLTIAEEYLRRAIDIDPSDPDQFIYLGTTHYKEGRLTEAAADIRQAIARKPNGTGYHFTLATIELQQGDRTSARAEMIEELRYHPDLAAVRGQLSALDRQLGDPTQ